MKIFGVEERREIRREKRREIGEFWWMGEIIGESKGDKRDRREGEWEVRKWETKKIMTGVIVVMMARNKNKIKIIMKIIKVKGMS